MDSVHGDIDKLFYAGGGTVAGDDNGTEGVDGGLDKYVGKREEGALDSSG